MTYQHDTTGEELAHRALQNRLGASFPSGRPPAGSGWSVKAPPVPTLDDLKARKRAEINGARDRSIAAGMDHNGIPVQTRPRDQINLIALKSAAETKKAQGDTSASMEFRDGDNIDHLLTPDEMIALAMDAMAFAQGEYSRAWSLKDQIPLATSEQDLDNIAW